MNTKQPTQKDAAEMQRVCNLAQQHIADAKKTGQILRTDATAQAEQDASEVLRNLPTKQGFSGFPLYLRDMSEEMQKRINLWLKETRPKHYQRIEEEGYDLEIGVVYDSNKWRVA